MATKRQKDTPSAAAAVVETEPTLPSALVDLGWTLQRGRNNVGWTAQHPAAHPAGEGALTFGTPDEAINAARELEAAATDDRMAGINRAADRLRTARQAAAAPDAASAPAIPDDLAALGWTLEAHPSRPGRWIPVHAVAGIRTTWAYPDPAGAIEYMREVERHAADLLCIADTAANMLRPFRQQAATDDPPRRSTRGATAARSETDLDDALYAQLVQAGYRWERATWTSAGWQHLIEQDGPEGIRQHLTIDGLRALVRALVDKPASPDVSLPDDLAALGWELVSNGDTWMTIHRASAVASAPYGAALGAVARAMEIEQLAAGPAEECFDPAANYLRTARQQAAPAHEVPPMTTETQSLPLNHLFARSGPERQEVRRDTIIPGRYQPRKTFDQAALEQLAASIREHGILNPLQVFQNERGQLELIAGERRLRAAGLAGLELVPVDVKAYTLAQIHEISLIDNLQREDLSEVEEGLAYERLISELGVSENKLAQRINKSRGHIQQRRAIAKAAPEVQQALADGKLSLTQARAIALAAPGDHGVQREALQQIVRNLKIGMHESEERCREQTVRIAATTHKKALKALGWKVQIDENSYRPPLIWSKTDKPRQWTGAEIISAVQEQRKPTAGAPVATKPDPEDVALMNAWAGQNGAITSTAAPWVLCHITATGERDSGEFLSADELHARCETIRQQIVAPVADRLQAQGWTLQVRSEQESGWTITHTSGYTLTSWNWSYVQERTTQIEQGQIDTSKPQQPSPVSRQLACVVCGVTEGTSWTGELRGYYCQPHGLEVQAEQRRLKEQRHGRAVAILEPLAAQADVDALRLLLFWLVSGYSEVYGSALGLTEYAAPEPLAAHIQTLDDAQIRQAVAQVLPARLINQYGTSAALGLLVDQPAEATA